MSAVRTRYPAQKSSVGSSSATIAGRRDDEIRTLGAAKNGRVRRTGPVGPAGRVGSEAVEGGEAVGERWKQYDRRARESVIPHRALLLDEVDPGQSAAE